MWHRGEDPSPGPSVADLRASDIRRRLASLKLASPLMLAAIIRPGLGEGAEQEQIIDAMSKLIARTMDLLTRVNAELEIEGFEHVNRYRIATEIVHLVAQHWKDESQISPETLEGLVVVAMKEGARLTDGLHEGPYQAGDDVSERLSSGISAAAKIALAMNGVVTAGHEPSALYKAFMEHLGKMVRETAESIGADRSIPAVKALIREFAQLYPVMWKQELDRVRDQLRAIPDVEARQAMAESISPYPLERFFPRVEQAASMLMEMADSMEVFVRPAVAQEPEQGMESA